MDEDDDNLINEEQFLKMMLVIYVGSLQEKIQLTYNM